MTVHFSGFDFRILGEASSDPPVWIIVLIPLAFIIVFPAFWCFVLWILSYAGGWKRLASRYRTQEEPTGGTYFGQQGMVGLVSYKGTLDFTTAEEGFFLRPNLLFRFGHPLLFIPWSDCHLIGKRSFLTMKWVRIQVGDPGVGRLSIPLQVLEETAGRVVLEKQA